jgi:hypothetical protein
MGNFFPPEIIDKELGTLPWGDKNQRAANHSEIGERRTGEKITSERVANCREMKSGHSLCELLYTPTITSQSRLTTLSTPAENILFGCSTHSLLV